MCLICTSAVGRGVCLTCTSAVGRGVCVTCTGAVGRGVSPVLVLWGEVCVSLY